MKLIILAAGQGTRLRPYTDDRPKCLVPFSGKPILDYILEAAKTANFSSIVVVTGYKQDKITAPQIKKITNSRYDQTNMLVSLFCAEEEMNEDVVISYSDIIYHPAILEKLVKSEKDFSVVIDENWKKLWEVRMDNPLNDAETLKISNNQITEIGKKPKSYDEIQGQYIGLIKISHRIINQVKAIYHSIDKNGLYDGKNFDNMFMTSFLQLLINRGIVISPVKIFGGWLEIDSVEDLEKYTENNPLTWHYS